MNMYFFHDCRVTNTHFYLFPEQIFVDPSEKDDLPDVLDDFELDFNAGSEEWVNHKAKEDNLQKFTESTAVHIINPPRKIISSGQYKPLLVLDLDHTLLDFSRSHLQGKLD